MPVPLACQRNHPARGRLTYGAGDHHRVERVRQRHRSQGSGGPGLLLGRQSAHRPDPEIRRAGRRRAQHPQGRYRGGYPRRGRAGKIPGHVQAPPQNRAGAADFSGSRRRRRAPPLQRNPPSPSAGTRPKRRGQHPQGARTTGAHPRAGRPHHQHQQVQRA